MTPEERIKRALSYAEYGTIDGDHHKMWTIDQMVRALTGCPMVEIQHIDAQGKSFSFPEQCPSDEYTAWVTAFEAGEDGPHTYEWDTGTPP